MPEGTITASYGAQRLVVHVLEALVDLERHLPLVAREGQPLLSPHAGEEVHLGALLGEAALVVPDLRLVVVGLHQDGDLLPLEAHRAPCLSYDVMSAPSSRRPGGGWPRPRRGRALPGARIRSIRNGPSSASASAIAGATSSAVSTRVAGNAHAPRELVEADLGIAEVERAGERVVVEAALAPVLLHVQLQQLVAAVVADDELGADLVARGRPHATGSCTSRRRRR